MSKYQELLTLAKSHHADRHDFEVRAINKVNEMVNELAAYLLAPKDRIAMMTLDPEEPDHQKAPGGTVITPKGLIFGVRIQFHTAHVQFASSIIPKGHSLHVATGKSTTIDVTDSGGVTSWCEWMNDYCHEQLQTTLNGELSALLSSP